MRMIYGRCGLFFWGLIAVLASFPRVALGMSREDVGAQARAVLERGLEEESKRYAMLSKSTREQRSKEVFTGWLLKPGMRDLILHLPGLVLHFRTAAESDDPVLYSYMFLYVTRMEQTAARALVVPIKEGDSRRLEFGSLVHAKAVQVLTAPRDRAMDPQLESAALISILYLLTQENCTDEVVDIVLAAGNSASLDTRGNASALWTSICQVAAYVRPDLIEHMMEAVEEVSVQPTDRERYEVMLQRRQNGLVALVELVNRGIEFDAERIVPLLTSDFLASDSLRAIGRDLKERFPQFDSDKVGRLRRLGRWCLQVMSGFMPAKRPTAVAVEENLDDGSGKEEGSADDAAQSSPQPPSPTDRQGLEKDFEALTVGDDDEDEGPGETSQPKKGAKPKKRRSNHRRKSGHGKWR